MGEFLTIYLHPLGWSSKIAPPPVTSKTTWIQRKNNEHFPWFSGETLQLLGLKIHNNAPCREYAPTKKGEKMATWTKGKLNVGKYFLHGTSGKFNDPFTFGSFFGEPEISEKDIRLAWFSHCCCGFQCCNYQETCADIERKCTRIVLYMYKIICIRSYIYIYTYERITEYQSILYTTQRQLGLLWGYWIYIF